VQPLFGRWLLQMHLNLQLSVYLNLTMLLHRPQLRLPSSNKSPCKTTRHLRLLVRKFLLLVVVKSKRDSIQIR